MRRSPDQNSEAFEKAALRLAGLVLLMAAALSGRLAWEHMVFLAEICGGSALVGHCVWCGATLALAATSLGSFVVAGRPRREAAPIRKV